jgi:hypothetical protein
MHQTTNQYYVEEPLPLLGGKHVPDSGGNQDENGEKGALGRYVAYTGTDAAAPQPEANVDGRTKPGAAIVS